MRWRRRSYEGGGGGGYEEGARTVWEHNLNAPRCGRWVLAIKACIFMRYERRRQAGGILVFKLARGLRASYGSSPCASGFSHIGPGRL